MGCIAVDAVQVEVPEAVMLFRWLQCCTITAAPHVNECINRWQQHWPLSWQLTQELRLNQGSR